MKNLKKVLVIALVIFASAFLFSSCKKCSHCVVTTGNGDIIKDYLQSCGYGKQIKDYDNNSKQDAAQYNGTVTCTN